MKKSFDVFINEVVQNIKDENNIVNSIIQKSKEEAKCNLVSRSSGVVSGLKVIQSLLKSYSPRLKMTIFKEDGSFINRGDPLCAILGPVDEIFKVEKTILSFVRLMSGISSITNKYKLELQGIKADLVYADTFIPSLEDLCINAFIDGGGTYYDESARKYALISRNVITRIGSVDECIIKIKENVKGYKTIVEVYDQNEMNEALRSTCTVIRVVSNKDNVIQECAKLNNGSKTLELLGEVELKNIRSLSKLGYSSFLIPSLTAGAHLFPIDLCFYKRF